VLQVISDSFPLPRPFARYARSLICGEQSDLPERQ